MRGEVIGDGNGTASISPADPIIAGSQGAWDITYVAGPQGVSQGGTVRFEIPYGFTTPNLKWYDAPGYTYVTCSRPDVQVRLTLDKPFSNDAYVTRWGRHVFATVAEGSLAPGDSITLHYGRYTAGGRSLFADVPTFAGEVEFTVATDCNGSHEAPFSGFYLVKDSPTLEIRGGPAARALLAGPSLVRPGRAQVALTALDRFANLASSELGEVRLVDQHGRVLTDWGVLEDAARWAEVEVGRLGPMVVLAETRDGRRVGSLPMLSAPDHPYTLYWGDLHSHTRLSDGLGNVDEYMTFARDVARLDFCGIGDHSQYLSDQDWLDIQDATRRYYQPGRFTTILAHEYSHNARINAYGDKVVLFPGDEAPLYRATTDLTKRQYTDLAEIAPKWRDLGAILTIHCHARGVTSYYDPELVRLLEIYSIWGSAERPGCLRQMLPSQERDYRGDFAVDALAAGYKVGFIASGDEHAGHPGLGSWLRIWDAFPSGITAVLAQANTRESIWEALWNRRCYATSGARMVLSFSVDEHPMGSILQRTGQPVRITAEAVGTAPIREATIVRNGQDMHTVTGAGYHLRLEVTDSPNEPTYYYLRVVQEDGEQGWASPVWVE
jgi:hypothetical protein